MKRLQKLVVISLGTLTACSGHQSMPRAETQLDLVTLDQEAGEDGVCHVHYQNVERKAPCAKIAALMRSELRIPAHAHLVLRPSKTVRYEEVSRLLQSLQGDGYKIGYVTSQ